jgi:hypothetical protein
LPFKPEPTGNQLTPASRGHEISPAMKHPRFRLACLGAALAVLSPVLPAAREPAAGDLPKLDTVLARYVEASGGKDRLEKITSRVVEGEVEMSVVPGALPMRILAKAPDKQLSVVTIPGFGEMREGYDGTNGWVKNPMLGLADRPAAEMAKVRRDAQFHRELNYRKIYPDLAVKRVDRSGAEALVVAESRPAPKALERFYFSQTSGLLVRQDSEFETQNGPTTASAAYEDHREVAGGVRVPHAIRITAKGADGVEMTIKFAIKDVKHNVPLDDAEFRKPAS